MSEKKEDFHYDLRYVLSAGFFGGIFASTLAYISFLLNFIPFGPGVILQTMTPVFALASANSFVGHALSILLIAFLSIGSSYLYYLLFRQLDSPWVGVCYGLAWWGIIFLGVNKLFPRLQGVASLGITTNIIFISIFIFYGLFVGYSISFQYQLEQLEKES